jgi:hypothetical protein
VKQQQTLHFNKLSVHSQFEEKKIIFALLCLQGEHAQFNKKMKKISQPPYFACRGLFSP